MPPYPIEIVNFGQPSFNTHVAVVRELNALQDEIVFTTPPDRFANWASPFSRERYRTSYVWDRLRAYRRNCKGFRPFLIAVVHGELASDRLLNLFGSAESGEGFAVITTRDWEEHFAPPALSVFLMYYFIRYSLGFIAPAVRSHLETRGCFFDKKMNKLDIKLSMASGVICDECREMFDDAIDGATYEACLTLVEDMRKKATGASPAPSGRQRVFLGSSTEGRRVAEYLQLGLDTVADCTLWSQGVFGLSRGNLENLVEASTQYDYAILVLTADDLVTQRDLVRNGPRDNVLFEFGLFMGALGRERTFAVYCENDPPLLPSDLAGVSFATFRKRHDGNLEAQHWVPLVPGCERRSAPRRVPKGQGLKRLLPPVRPVPAGRGRAWRASRFKPCRSVMATRPCRRPALWTPTSRSTTE